MQALYIAQVSGMLNVPTNCDGLSKAELSRTEVQLLLVNELLKMDLRLAYMRGSDFVIDDSNYTVKLRLQDMPFRKPVEVQRISHTQDSYVIHDYSILFEGSGLKTLQGTINV
ncbi:hypothetical protein HDU91_002987, partial [Kappamyces sp. JEL0680]